jgi:4-amino-4-deoxy-L-arabinose transferase-like glycosyltransferase
MLTAVSVAAVAPPGLSRRTLFGIFLLALVPRLALAGVYVRAPIGLDDMYQYDMLARSIASGNGYRWYQRQDVAFLQPYLRRFYDIQLAPSAIPEDGYLTTFRAPGYPFFLAGLYLLVGGSWRIAAARLIQALLTATLAPLTTLLAAEAGLRRRASLVSGSAVAVYPILWMYPLGLGSENLFMPLLLGAVVLMLAAARLRSRARLVASGLVLGAAILTRPALALFLPPAALWIWRRVGLRPAVLTIVAALTVLTPWAIRNSLVLGRPAFVENSLGYNLFVGYHPEGDGGFVNEIGVIPTRFLDDAERDRWTMQQALGFIRADPGRVPELMARRLVYFWGLEDRELLYFYANDFFGPIPAPGLVGAYLVLISPLIIIGLSAPWGMALGRPDPARSLIMALIAATMLAYVPILSEPRFHLPLIPFLAAYAAEVWSTPHPWREIRDALRARRPGAWIAAAACAALIAIWIIDFTAGLPRLAAILAPGGNRLWLNY